jgi:hypothetical protein
METGATTEVGELGERAQDALLAAGFRRDPELFTAVYERYFRESVCGGDRS